METKHTSQQSWVKEKLKKEIQNYLKTNENKNTIHNNMESSKTVHRTKYITIHACIKKLKPSLILYLKELGKNTLRPKLAKGNMINFEEKNEWKDMRKTKERIKKIRTFSEKI